MSLQSKFDSILGVYCKTQKQLKDLNISIEKEIEKTDEKINNLAKQQDLNDNLRFKVHNSLTELNKILGEEENV